MTDFIVLNINNDGADSLRSAITDANGNPGPDTIAFANELAAQTITLSTGALSITESVIIDGDLDDDGNPDITLDANGNSRVLNVNDGNDGILQDVTLKGLIITGGQVSDSGGGINNSENLTLNNATVSGNSTVGILGYGGGIFSTAGHLVLNNVTIAGNATSDSFSDGGGIAISEGKLTLNNSIVTGNRTAGSRGYGGGIFGFSSELALNDALISDNATLGEYNSDGGGIANYGGTLTLNRTTVSGNTTTGSLSPGGGIANPFGTLTLNDSTVSGNATEGRFSSGGGILSAGESVLNNTTVSGNFTTGLSSYGGGISSARNPLTLNNTTVSGNATAGRLSVGGGIFGFNNTLTLNNTTVSGNVTTGDYASGGGIVSLASGPLSLRSSLVSGNRAAVAEDDELTVTGTVDTDGNNLFGDAGKTSVQAFGSFSPGPGDVNATSDGNNPAALEDILSPLADNGGDTLTHAIPPGSPALDTGANPQDFPTDQRGPGFVRTFGAGTDIGAFELQDDPVGTPPVAVPTLHGSGLLALTVLLGALALRYHRARIHR